MKLRWICRWMCMVVLLASSVVWAQQDVPKTTRIEDPHQHERKGADSYPYREWSKYIARELDIHAGDRVLDVGAGDGWWIQRFIEHGGTEAVYYALEVEEEKVSDLKETFAGQENVKPLLAPESGTGLEENSIDLVFFSQVYHHLPEGGHVDYLKHLKSVVTPTGRVCVIEKYQEIATRNPDHSTQLSELIRQAEEADWILLRYQLIPNTYHYLTIFAQKEMFPPKPEEDKPQSTSMSHTDDSIDAVKSALMSGKAILVDVREQNEWDEGHLQQAHLLPLSLIQTLKEDEKALENAKSILNKEKIIYTHCRRGGRALRAGNVLKDLGYDVRPLPLGYEALVNEGFKKAD